MKEIDIFAEDCDAVSAPVEYPNQRNNNNNHEQQQQILLQPGDRLNFSIARSKRSGKLKCILPRITRFAPEGREVGVVTNLKVKEGFGFLKVVGRGTDSYFRLADLLPPRATLTEPKQKKLTNGMHVSFDLSVDVRNSTNNNYNIANANNINSNSNSLRALRISILPNKSIQLSLPLTESPVTGSIANGGFIELDAPLDLPSDFTEAQYPSFANTIKEVFDSQGEDGNNINRGEIRFPRTLTFMERQIVGEMIERNKELLCVECTDGTLAVRRKQNGPDSEVDGDEKAETSTSAVVTTVKASSKNTISNQKPIKLVKFNKR